MSLFAYSTERFRFRTENLFGLLTQTRIFSTSYRLLLSRRKASVYRNCSSLISFNDTIPPYSLKKFKEPPPPPQKKKKILSPLWYT